MEMLDEDRKRSLFPEPVDVVQVVDLSTYLPNGYSSITGSGISFLPEARKFAGVVYVILPAIITAVGSLFLLTIILASLGAAIQIEKLRSGWNRRKRELYKRNER